MNIDEIDVKIEPMRTRGMGRIKQFQIETISRDGKGYCRAFFFQMRDGKWNLCFPYQSVDASEGDLRCLVRLAATANFIARPEYVSDFQI